MRFRWLGLSAALLLVFLRPSQAQTISENLLITTDRAWTWTEGTVAVVTLEGPVSIRTDDAVLTARRAVVWLSPVPGALLGQQQADVALIGDARVVQGEITQSGERMLVNFIIRGPIRVTAESRTSQNMADSELYRLGLALRPGEAPLPEALAREEVPGQAPGQPAGPVVQRPWVEQVPDRPSGEPASPPSTRPAGPDQPVAFRAADVQMSRSPDGKVALVLSDGVSLFQKQLNGAFVELQADRAVIFTTLDDLRDLAEEQAQQFKSVEDAVTAAYLEGDVRIVYTPPNLKIDSERRLEGNRVYYEFATNRAVLTDAVLHTTEPERKIPITLRAGIIRQLALGEYRADQIELSTSNLAVPSYSIRATKAYVKQVETGDPRYGTRTTFQATDTTFHLYGAPVFWTPSASGSLTDRGSALREIVIGGARDLGFGIRTKWGVFETLGMIPPDELDLAVRLDYFTRRGFAAGLEGSYEGGYVSEITRQPWTFQGNFQSYFVPSDGDRDRLGRNRARVDEEGEFRGRVLWEHQHFFRNDWQLQLRGGWVSDGTFLEEWFEDEFNNGRPLNQEAYLKRQRQTEAFTILFSLNCQDLVTTSDGLQERVPDEDFPGSTLDRLAIVEKLPEIGYYRIGDSWFEDSATFFSFNTVSALRFNNSSDSLADLGFRDPNFATGRRAALPGFPSYAQTGFDDEMNYRGDFRQEWNFPFQAGQFKVLPYIFGRYTGYADGPDDNDVHRFMAGAGVRINTAFWRVDDSVEDDMWDLHRMRHVIEPELHLFTTVACKDRGDVFIYDEGVDDINDISGVQLAVRQRWQTKRGGPGRWRSVDWFVLNFEANLFCRQPDEFVGIDRDGKVNDPGAFRGLFFASAPEASIPRTGFNVDALWRVSDSTVILADASYNLDEHVLSTASIGAAAQRDTRLSYFAGLRYIGDVNSTIGSFVLNYEISAKYSAVFAQSFDFSGDDSNVSRLSLTRRFDRYFVTVTFYYDEVDDESGVTFAVYPEGLGYGLESGQLQALFGQ